MCREILRVRAEKEVISDLRKGFTEDVTLRFLKASYIVFRKQLDPQKTIYSIQLPNLTIQYRYRRVSKDTVLITDINFFDPGPDGPSGGSKFKRSNRVEIMDKEVERHMDASSDSDLDIAAAIDKRPEREDNPRINVGAYVAHVARVAQSQHQSLLRFKLMVAERVYIAARAARVAQSQHQSLSRLKLMAAERVYIAARAAPAAQSQHQSLSRLKLVVAERAYIAARAAHGKSTLGAMLTKVHAETLGEGNGNIDSEEERNREITLSGVHLRVYKFAYATQMLRLGLISRLQRKIVGDLIMQGVTRGNSVSHRAPGSIGQCQHIGTVQRIQKKILIKGSDCYYQTNTIFYSSLTELEVAAKSLEEQDRKMDLPSPAVADLSNSIRIANTLKDDGFEVSRSTIKFLANRLIVRAKKEENLH